MSRRPAARLVSLALCAALAAGCTTTVEIRGPIPPAVVPPERLPSKVAVVFPEPMESFGESVRLGRVLRVIETRYFDYGDVLWDALFRSVLAAYKDVTHPEGALRPGQYDRVIKFFVQIQEGSGKRRFVESAGDRFSIAVTMEALDGASLESVRRTALRRDVIYNGDPDGFGPTIEKTIQQLSNDVAKLLAEGFAERGPGPP